MAIAPELFLVWSENTDKILNYHCFHDKIVQNRSICIKYLQIKKNNGLPSRYEIKSNAESGLKTNRGLQFLTFRLISITLNG